jgi:rSAM/selenodomain-associated transferase 1
MIERGPTVFIVFARAPEPGRVKTRLAATLGDADALAIYHRLGTHTLRVVRAAAERQPGSRVVVYHAPAEASHAMAAWLGHDLEYRPQCGGDLGARMANAVAAELSRGAANVVVVGTDCPELDADVLTRAVASLEDVDVALGPATDGGYYLLATRRTHPALFQGIPWSSADTLRHTLAAAARSGVAVRLLDERSDIDTADDWRAWVARGAHQPPGLTPRNGR